MASATAAAIFHRRRLSLAFVVTIVSACGVDTGADRTDTSASSASGGSELSTGGAGGAGGATPAPASTSSGSVGGAANTLRYHQVRAKSSHNAYQRHEAVFDQLAYHRIRSIEFDIHTDKLGWGNTSGDWYVYHDTFGPQTTCHRLSDCLRELRAFHDAVPEHEVITLVIDNKSAFKGGQNPADLDALLQASLPENTLYRPEQALADCPNAQSLRDALAGTCQWPSLAKLRGKIVVVITGGDGCNGQSLVSQYAPNAVEAANRVAFIAPDIHGLCPWSSYASASDHVAFFNMNSLDATSATEVHRAGLVARVWGLNDPDAWDKAIDAGTHLLGTDKVNAQQDPWAATHSSDGWPFECLESCTPPATELGQLLSVHVDSGDIWGTQDSFYFLYRDTTAAEKQAATWTSYVSTPNSHTEPWAKACLMARGSDDEASSYLAVCRPADVHRIRVQVRPTTGGNTQAYDVKINPDDTIDDPSAPFIRLEIDDGGLTLRGLASQDGTTWITIHEHTFQEPLPLRGVAGSSHGSGSTRFLFGQLHRSISGTTPTPQGEQDLAALAIGTDASGSVHDGF